MLKATLARAAIGGSLHSFVPQSMETQQQGGLAHLFSFPFWVMVDTTSPMETVTATVGVSSIRIYPPFRSAPANVGPMPAINPREIPFFEEAKPINPLKLLNLMQYPLLKSEGGPGAGYNVAPGWEKRPRIFPMDSLRIDLIAMPQSYRLEPLLQRLLERLRHRTRQWWILRSIEPLLGYERNRFRITANGSPIEVSGGAEQHTHVPFGFERALDNSRWKACLEEAVKEVQTPVYEMSVLDAYHSLAANDINAAIMNASWAAEQAVEATFQRLWATQPGGRKFRRGRLTGNDATVHISRDMDRYFGRSFRRECPGCFMQMRLLWRARGNVAHGGKPQNLDLSKLNSFHEDPVRKLIKAVQISIKWMNSLA